MRKNKARLHLQGKCSLAFGQEFAPQAQATRTAPVVPAVTHGGTYSILNSNTSGTVTPLGTFTNNSGNSNPYNNVKAGVCYILFDEQFNLVSCQFDPVYANLGGYKGSVGGPESGLKNHFMQNISVPKNGYLYVYCSNESNINVYFDNMEVIHTRGQILEEAHYYPFGLTMAGISSKAAGKLQNNKQFNGIEHTTDLDLNQYDAFFRTMDPQIGRWWQIDPKPSNDISPYAAMDNNPISRSDFLGDETDDKNPKKPHPKPHKPQIVPIIIPQNKWPNVFNTTVKGLQSGHGLLLTYDPSRTNANRRRTAAKNGQKAAPGNHIDEYPYASTQEGGKGAATNEIPGEENSAHGGYIGNQVVKYKMQAGDKFLVIPIPNEELEKQTAPATALSTAGARQLSTYEQRTPYCQYGYLPGGSAFSPEMIKNIAAQGTAAYITVKLIEAAIVIATDGAAAPIMGL